MSSAEGPACGGLEGRGVAVKLKACARMQRSHSLDSECKTQVRCRTPRVECRGLREVGGHRPLSRRVSLGGLSLALCTDWPRRAVSPEGRALPPGAGAGPRPDLSAHTALLSLRVSIYQKLGEMDFPLPFRSIIFAQLRGQHL